MQRRGRRGGIRAATCYEACSGFGGKPMRNLAHQSEWPFLRPRMAQVTCPSTTVVGPLQPFDLTLATVSKIDKTHMLPCLASGEGRFHFWKEGYHLAR